MRVRVVVRADNDQRTLTRTEASNHVEEAFAFNDNVLKFDSCSGGNERVPDVHPGSRQFRGLINAARVKPDREVPYDLLQSNLIDHRWFGRDRRNERLNGNQPRAK